MLKRGGKNKSNKERESTGMLSPDDDDLRRMTIRSGKAFSRLDTFSNTVRTSDKFYLSLSLEGRLPAIVKLNSATPII